MVYVSSRHSVWQIPFKFLGSLAFFFFICCATNLAATPKFAAATTPLRLITQPSLPYAQVEEVLTYFGAELYPKWVCY